jgi:CRP-like cAMP-binding protein
MPASPVPATPTPAPTGAAPRLDEAAFFKGAEPALLERFRARALWASHEPGELVIDFDDVSDDVFFVISGSMRAIVRAPNGREVILGDLLAGQFFGEMAAIDALPRSAAVTALHRARSLRMAGAVFMELVTQSPILSHRLMKVLTDRIRTGNARLLEHSTLNARHRLYAELLRLARPRPGGGLPVISPPPAQHVLAARIGVRREAVSREIAEMLRKGLIERSAKAITLLKPDALRAAIAAEQAD